MRPNGPSPRVRGSPRSTGRRSASRGSIPACAGKPPSPAPRATGARVHPRVCGEAGGPVQWLIRGRGPSPRVRGSPAWLGETRPVEGSIPACAGKPVTPASRRHGATVHPRVCGEALGQHRANLAREGPSPRVRGSPYWRILRAPEDGSIPACAGKPNGTTARQGRRRVHPRVCGEATYRRTRQSAMAGPSPRVRGSHCQRRTVGNNHGSIPACAGKPYDDRVARLRHRVHPRVCGEAVTTVWPACAPPGPSPRVRGSLCPRRTDHRRQGSIPACAGKPPPGTKSCPRGRVHPRVCGEARGVRELILATNGPSPRVRGSPDSRDSTHAWWGSIPACAGKPSDKTGVRFTYRVHPRVCGEAPHVGALGSPVRGPSPRVRGSLLLWKHVAYGAGSIPACAGKPGKPATTS